MRSVGVTLGEMPDLFENVVNLAKRRGFVFPSSEIYGGFRSTYDYGPLGVLMKRNLMEAWWRAMVQERDDIVGLDAAILMAPRVWEASGHVATFTDPLVDCRNCKSRWREDELVERACLNCGSTDLTAGPRLQPHVQDPRGPGGGRRRRSPTCAPRPRRASSSTSRTCCRRAARSRPSGSPSRASRSATRSRRATSSSARASSSRWRWSTSCRPTRAPSGSSTGARSGCAGTPTSASPRSSCACACTTPTSSATTPRARPTSSSSIPGAGASWRASPTAPTTTSSSTPSSRASGSSTSTRRRASATCRT